MEPFVNIFFAIDEQQNETITRDELRRYVKHNHLDEGMITRWQSLFDPTNSGIITFQKFCDVLGVKPEQARTLRKSVINNRPLPKDLQIISQNMSSEDQFQIFEFVRSLLDKNLSVQDMTQMIKQWLDKTFDPSRHVVIIDGSYWISYSHLPEQSLQFRLKEKCYLVWRTPKH
uniref:Tegumental antigen n=1 Tax=Schistosoma mansoni TaxID=6183 RepID=I4EC24_SCHMA|nr:tegumental antigen [Schistosoma mansoni]